MSTRTSKHCLVTKKCMGCTCGSRQKPGQRQQLEEAAAVAGQSRCLRAVPWHPEPIGRAPGEHSEVRQQEAMSTHVVALPAKLQAGRATGRSLMHVSTSHPCQTSAQTTRPPSLSLLKEQPQKPLYSFTLCFPQRGHQHAAPQQPRTGQGSAPPPRRHLAATALHLLNTARVKTRTGFFKLF